MPTPYQTALDRIREAAASGADSLDLSWLGLEDLPPEIGALTQLKELNLRRNQLTALPPEIGALTQLTTLYLDDNRLTALPPEIGALTQLTTLNLSWNRLTALPPEIGALTQLTTLDLSWNQLTALPPEIGALTQLTMLDLDSNDLTALPPELWRLPRLVKLYISGNPLPEIPPELWQKTDWEELGLASLHLTALPPEIGALTQLQELYLWDNHLTALPPELWRLPRLVKLYISGNPLPEIPPELWQKTDWEELGLASLRLTALPPEIGALTQLKKLSLHNNHLTALPPELWCLPRLVKLDISHNPLPEIPPELWQKTDWEELGLGGLNLTALPPEIGALTQLTTLDLQDNHLTALPPEIGALTQLTTLDLQDNQLTALPPEIGALTHLTTLDLGGNHLTALPPEIGALTQLTRLDLQDNQLTALPPELAQLTRLERLALHGNPLTLALPRALVGVFLGDYAPTILRFYRAIWQAGKALGEARVLFVGQPAAGKTSLVHRLKDGSYQRNRPSTMTVETHALPFGGATAHVWDFGGQDFMHATHPFFFSARCVYVLVLNVRQTYEQNRVDYWLRTIRAFGGDSPVIVVGNHADADQHVLDLPQNRLRREFPTIAAFVQTSAEQNRGVEDLRAALTEAVNALPHARVLFAQSHLAIKEALEREKQKHDIIPYPRYAGLCAEQGIEDEEDQRTLLALLHDLGVVLDFRDEAGEPLCPDGILNPNWVTNAVYRLITDQELRTAAAGRLTPDMLRRILPEYAPYHRDLMLKLMRRFELAYPAEAEAWYLPNAMPQDEPAAASDSAWADALTFEYAYPELPESVITRFIVRAHAWIEAGQVWRWGVILAWNDNRALVRADAAQKKIELRIGGAEHTRREMLALLRGHFEVIHKTFTEGAGKEAFPIQELVCPPQYPGLRLDYRKLLTYERDGVSEIPETWQSRTIHLNVTEALNGFTTPEARREERRRLFPEEERMREKEDKTIRVDIHGDLKGGNIIIGKDNQVQQTIQSSFNTGLSPEVASTLAQLTAAVQEMLKHLPAEQADETAEDLKKLREELSKPKPSKKWYSVSIEGLVKAAKNLGKVGAPVVELAGKLLQLLG